MADGWYSEVLRKKYSQKPQLSASQALVSHTLVFHADTHRPS